MLNISLNDGKIYTFNINNLNLEYFDSGDLHGNDNFRINNASLPVYKVLLQIDTDLLSRAVAATLNGKLVSLTENITNDCSLEIITTDTPVGKMISNRSLAFILAQTIFSLQPNTCLKDVFITQNKSILYYDYSSDIMPPVSIIKQAFTEQLSNHTAIQTRDSFQKEVLLDNFPSLLQPYAQRQLNNYDEFEFVPIALRNNFALPINKDDIFTPFPNTLEMHFLDISIISYSFALTIA